MVRYRVRYTYDVCLEQTVVFCGEPMNIDKTFTVTVDGEPVEIPRKGVTPRLVLQLAGLDPETRYLIEKRGSQTISYRDNPDAEISVHENQVFLSARFGPVPVS